MSFSSFLGFSMHTLSTVHLPNWRRVFTTEAFISAVSFPVFALLDLLDFFLCFFFRFADFLFEGKSSLSNCYCWSTRNIERENEENKISETLFRRRNIFRELGILRTGKIRQNEALSSPRWSDCRCQICVSWVAKGNEKLHFIVKEPSQDKDKSEGSIDSIIFLHGFLSSSSMWTEMVFPYISPLVSKRFRLFAVDLLGFGKSPKPGDCLYTLKDQVEMIEKTLIHPFHLDSFHLVAHSMGSIIALAIAEKFPTLVKSITLAAPPYFSSDEGESHNLLKRVVPRKIWPPLTFGASVMSWYEHLGRSICFFVCRCHTKWEWILKLITGRDLHFMTVDLTKHTHHSAWHTMHNVICGVDRSMDGFFETLNRAQIPGLLIHGSDDQIVPLDCSYRMKKRAPHLDIMVISGVDHSSVIFGREKRFTKDLERFLLSPSVQKTYI